MILQRIRVREPVVIMGETGCGKTYLIRYIVEVLYHQYAEYREFILHTGVEEHEFIDFMYDIIDEANAELERTKEINVKNKDDKIDYQEKPKIFWVFFDEFNTSHLQAYISEIMNDRVFSLGEKKSCKFFLIKIYL